MSGSGPTGGGHVDEGTIHAWLDGQLSSDEAVRLSAHVAGCEACSALVAAARGHVAAATRILNALDGVPAQVVPRATRRVQRWHLRAAAAIVVMALGTAVVLRGPAASLRSMYEAPPVAAVRPSEAPTRQQTPPAPAPRAGAATRVAGPMVRGESKEADTEKKRLQADGLGRAPQPQALAAKTPHVLRDEAEATPSGSAVSGPAFQGRRATPAPVPPSTTDSDTSGARVAAPLMGPAAASPRQIAPRAAADALVRHITGRVVDADSGERIPSALVQVRGTPIGQTTTDSGSFALAVPSNATTLTVRRIGYLAQTVPLTPGATDFTILLKEDALRLESQVEAGAATAASAQSAVSILKMPAESTGSGAAGARAAPGTASRCRGQIVQLPSPDSAVRDSIAVRLTGVPSIDADYPGLVVRPVPDTVGATFGRWQPIGTDSALIAVTRPGGAIAQRVGCY